MPTVILDTDGVLLNWRDTFSQWLVDHGYMKSNTEWLRSEYDPPIGAEDDRRLIKIFNQTHYIRNLPVIAGAVQALNKFHERGYTIKVCTSFSSEYASMVMREENLTKHFGNIFTEIRSVPLGADKVKFLERHLDSDTIFVEDSVNHIQDALNIGYRPHQLFLIADEYNYNDYKKIIPLAYRPLRGNWKDIMENLFI